MSGPEDLPLAGVPPEEAIAFFRQKGYRIGFNWQDVFQGEHARSFTVAKAMSVGVLEDIRDAVDRALAEGTTLADFRRELRPLLEAKGWWGRKAMIDPLTAERRVVQLGSARRLRTIFDTNLRTAYAAGKWERIERTKAAFPYLEYSAMDDSRVRPQHDAWDGTILPVGDPWWDTHYPPCDWSCRCTVVQRSERMLERQGKAVTGTPPRNPDVPWTNTRTGETGVNEDGIGKGWNYNVGREHLRGLAPRPWPDDGDGGPGPAPTRAQEALFDRFTAHFGIAPGREGVWRDRDGHPLAIGRGWFIGANGAVRLPRGSAGVAIDRIAGAITEPDSIDWAWEPGADGRPMLLRRYARSVNGVTAIVHVGRGVWRWEMRREAAGVSRSAAVTTLSAALRPDEIDAINDYTGPGYDLINRRARGLAGDDDDDLAWTMAALDAAIAKGRIAESVVLHRTLTGDGVDWIDGQALRPGSIFADPGFISTTKELEFARKWGAGAEKRVILEIHATRDIVALDITDTSSQGTGEYEVLFPRDTRMRVIEYDAESRILKVRVLHEDED